MKRLYFALALALSIFAIVGSGMYFVKQASNELKESLEQIETAAKNNDFDKALYLCEKAEDNWVKSEKKLTYFVNHSEICIIGESISSIQAFAKYKEKAELFSELNKTRVIITHLSAMENVKK